MSSKQLQQNVNNPSAALDSGREYLASEQGQQHLSDARDKAEEYIQGRHQGPADGEQGGAFAHTGANDLSQEADQLASGGFPQQGLGEAGAADYARTADPQYQDGVPVGGSAGQYNDASAAGAASSHASHPTQQQYGADTPINYAEPSATTTGEQSYTGASGNTGAPSNDAYAGASSTGAPSNTGAADSQGFSEPLSSVPIQSTAGPEENGGEGLKTVSAQEAQEFYEKNDGQKYERVPTPDGPLDTTGSVDPNSTDPTSVDPAAGRFDDRREEDIGPNDSSAAATAGKASGTEPVSEKQTGDVINSEPTAQEQPSTTVGGADASKPNEKTDGSAAKTDAKKQQESGQTEKKEKTCFCF